MENVALNPGFKQVCVWPGCIVKPDEISQVEELFLNEFDVRIQYLETVVTKPDIGEFGYLVEGTGGRHDILFAVHDEDVSKFAVSRLLVGIRWIDDVYGSEGSNIYPRRVAGYKSWAC